MKNKQETPSVYLIGLGIPEMDAMTAEAGEALKKCRTVFTVGAGCSRGGFLGQFCPDIRKIYTDDSRKDQDAEVRSKIMQIFAALKQKGPVAFVTFGHPMFYDIHCYWLKQVCEARNIPCRVISSVSTFDAVFSALRIDLIGGQGVQLGDIDAFTRNAPNPASYVLVYRPNSNPQQLKAFLKECLKIYPASHRLAFVRCYNSTMPERITWHRLKTCAGKLKELTQWTSILLPPLCPVKAPRQA